MAKFYAVKEGYRPGVYTTWAECQEQIKGYKGALYKSFSLEEDAKEFVYGGANTNPIITNGLTEEEIDNIKWELYGIREGLKERDIAFILGKVNAIASLLHIELEKESIEEYIREKKPKIEF